MQTARQLFITGSAIPGEKIGDMLERLRAAGATIYDDRGRRLDMLTLAAQANPGSCQVHLSEETRLKAFSPVYAGPSRIFAEDIKHTCTVCGKVGGLGVVGANDIEMVLCIDCGSSDFPEHVRTERTKQNLLEACQANNIVLSFVR